MKKAIFQYRDGGNYKDEVILNTDRTDLKEDDEVTFEELGTTFEEYFEKEKDPDFDHNILEFIKYEQEDEHTSKTSEESQFDGIAFLLPPTDPFDAFEIHPVKDITEDGDEGTHFEQCEPEEAELWSVYVRYIPTNEVAGLECLADCNTKEQAEALVATLEKMCEMYKPNHVEHDEYGPIGILSIGIEEVSKPLYNKLHNKKAWTYEDKKGLQEHLFSCGVRDNGDIETLWTSEQEEELRKIEQQCADKDCGYFRIISS